MGGIARLSPAAHRKVPASPLLRNISLAHLCAALSTPPTPFRILSASRSATLCDTPARLDNLSAGSAGCLAHAHDGRRPLLPVGRSRTRCHHYPRDGVPDTVSLNFERMVSQGEHKSPFPLATATGCQLVGRRRGRPQSPPGGIGVPDKRSQRDRQVACAQDRAEISITSA